VPQSENWPGQGGFVLFVSQSYPEKLAVAHEQQETNTARPLPPCPNSNTVEEKLAGGRLACF